MRAAPALILPALMYAFTGSGSFSSLSVFVTWLRLLPTILAISSWLC